MFTIQFQQGTISGQAGVALSETENDRQTSKVKRTDSERERDKRAEIKMIVYASVRTRNNFKPGRRSYKRGK